ncbi:hypothetical protein D3C85_765500 [compost metagenome]
MLVRRGDQRRQAGELDPALQALDLAGRAGEVELGNGQHAETGGGLLAPVEASLEPCGAFDRGLHIIGCQGAEVVGLQAVLAEGQVGGADGHAARLGLAIVTQVHAAYRVLQTAQVEAAAPDVVGQSRFADRRQRQEALGGGGVGDLGRSDRCGHRQAGGPPVHHQSSPRVGEAHGQEGGGGGDVGQRPLRPPRSIRHRDQRAVGGAEATGDVGHVVFAQFQPLDAEGNAVAGRIGETTSVGGQLALGRQGDVAGGTEVQRRLAVQRGAEAAGRQGPRRHGDPRLRQTAAALRRQAQGPAARLTGLGSEQGRPGGAERQKPAIGRTGRDRAGQDHLGPCAAGGQPQSGGVEGEGVQRPLQLGHLGQVVAGRRAEAGP